MELDGADRRLSSTQRRDFAGTVDQVGAGAESYRRGDDVFGFLVHADPAVHNGSWSELAAVPADPLVVPKPANVGLTEAGAAPLVGVTAMASIEALDLRADEPLLLVGATGGVGSVAVQLARLAGARVIAPGLPEDRECQDAGRALSDLTGSDTQGKLAITIDGER